MTYKLINCSMDTLARRTGEPDNDNLAIDQFRVKVTVSERDVTFPSLHRN